MQLDSTRSTWHTATSGESPSGWILGLPGTDETPVAPARAQLDSFRAECECPDDCLRDHENE